MIGTSLHLATRAATSAVHPLATISTLRDSAEGLGEIVWAALNPAPQTPLNVEIGPYRRFTVVRQELSDYKAVKNALGGTVNDVVLSVVSGALAQWLRSRGVRTEGVEMRALVPVSVRGQDQRGTLGNQLSAMRGPLPVYITDPVARLRFVSQAMDGLKESKQAVGAATLAAVNNLAPPTILAQASRLNFSTRLFNLLVTNIPGPQLPLYVLGRKLEDLFPVAFLPENHALAIAIMSYDGGVDYGLLGDFDTLPDIDMIAEGIDDALQELLDAAAAASAERPEPSGAIEAVEGAEEVEAAHEASEGDQAQNGAPVQIVPLPSGRGKRGPAADMRAKRSSRRPLPGTPPTDE